MMSSNTRFQTLMSHHSIWTQIDVSWPPDVLDLYLEKSDGRDVSLTIRMMDDPGNGGRVARNQLYSESLKRCLPRAKHLHLCVGNRGCNLVFAKALDSYAPRLRTLRLELDDRVHVITSVFALGAPLLENAFIRGPHPVGMHRFVTLRHLDMQLTKTHHDSVLPMLEAMPHLRYVSFGGEKSGEKMKTFKPKEKIIALPFCESFSIRSMQIDFARKLINHLELPSTARLDIELQITNFDVAPPNQQLSVELFILPPLLATNTLNIELLSDSVLLYSDGVPSHRFSIDWQSFRTSFASSTEEYRNQVLRRIMGCLIDSMTFCITELALYKAAFSGDEEATAPGELEELCAFIYRECDSVEVLQLFGDILEPVKALRDLNFAEHLLDLEKLQLGVSALKDPIAKEILEEVAQREGFVQEEV
ncbi:hypothetical protein SISSUDRAFT_1047950 [Sistotremastrum suecicum HHB10207 ss-3]|uniref:Uncharacterized protein n=1 Tax=Sistotremastrum suecicum HHB10207 ss-3 TaxID=1314776 RepID=A0A166CVD1_9AGAM|nr:hypothetical protein SISSUDRAFT_1047950 [Sistotremastrum suecicum HHB10207 ss-3]